MFYNRICVSKQSENNSDPLRSSGRPYRPDPAPRRLLRRRTYFPYTHTHIPTTENLFVILWTLSAKNQMTRGVPSLLSLPCSRIRRNKRSVEIGVNSPPPRLFRKMLGVREDGKRFGTPLILEKYSTQYPNAVWKYAIRPPGAPGPFRLPRLTYPARQTVVS